MGSSVSTWAPFHQRQSLHGCASSMLAKLHTSVQTLSKGKVSCNSPILQSIATHWIRLTGSHNHWEASAVSSQSRATSYAMRCWLWSPYEAYLRITSCAVEHALHEAILPSTDDAQALLHVGGRHQRNALYLSPMVQHVQGSDASECTTIPALS